MADTRQDGSPTRFVVAEDGMGNSQANTVPFNPRLTTHDGQQYIAYWTHDGGLAVAERDLPRGEWTTTRLDVSIDQRDGHYAPALGVGPDGHIFLCYNTRDSPIRWRRSVSPGDVSAFAEETVGLTGRDETSACYPEFTRLRDGTLLFGYREGYSGNGNWHLNRWADGEWDPLQHSLTDGEGERNSYHWNLFQSSDGVLHYAFCWRNNDLDVEGIANSKLSYARSPDGGETWERSDGTEYTLPITKDAAEPIDPVSAGHNLINQGWTAFDPRTDEPHVAYVREGDSGSAQLYHAFMDDGTWRRERVTDRDAPLQSADSFGHSLARPGIVVDRDGTVHMVTRDTEHGGWPLHLERRDGEWRASVLYRRNLTYAEIHIDPERWRDDRVLSVVEQAQSTLTQDPGRGPEWAPRSEIAVTDVHPNGRGGTTAGAHRPVFASASLRNPPAVKTQAAFETVGTAIPFSERTVPATPVYARFTGEFAVDEDTTGRVRVIIEDVAGSTHAGRVTRGEQAVIEGDAGLRTTGWVRVPTDLRGGRASVQLAAEGPGEVRISNGILELSYRDPRGSLSDYVV